MTLSFQCKQNTLLVHCTGFAYAKQTGCDIGQGGEGGRLTDIFNCALLSSLLIFHFLHIYTPSDSAI